MIITLRMNLKKNALYISRDMPNPFGTGSAQRSFRNLWALAKVYSVDLIVMYPASAPREALDLCRSITLFPDGAGAGGESGRTPRDPGGLGLRPVAPGALVPGGAGGGRELPAGVLLRAFQPRAGHRRARGNGDGPRLAQGATGGGGRAGGGDGLTFDDCPAACPPQRVVWRRRIVCQRGPRPINTARREPRPPNDVLTRLSIWPSGGRGSRRAVFIGRR